MTGTPVPCSQSHHSPLSAASIRHATEKWERFFGKSTTAYRLLDVHDATSGQWSLDRLGSVLLLQAENRLPEVEFSAALGLTSLYAKPLGAPERDRPRHLAGERQEAPFEVREADLRFLCDMGAGYSTGLFLDHRENRKRLASSRPRSLLNCFAYTCAFSVHAAAAGAETVSIDLSRHALVWGERNFTSNRLDPTAHEFLAGDVLEWLPRLARKGRRFEAIVLDPPTFSRNRKGKTFQVEADLGRLIALALPLLAPNGTLLVSCNCRRLPPGRIRKIITDTVPRPIHLEPARPGPDFKAPALLRGFWVTS